VGRRRAARRASRSPGGARFAAVAFLQAPLPTIVRALDTIVDPHRELADHGWIAGNFYDGCLIDDFSAERLAMVDLDPYHKGPFVNTMGRIFGSTGFMAPEEFRRGAAINERTSVFTLGRVLAVFLSDG